MANISRRWFIGGAASAAILPPRLFAVSASTPLAGTPRVKIGVLSDIHLRDNKESSWLDFSRALAHFRDCGVDGVLIAGDIADTGRVSELKRCAELWFKAFPDGKAPDGRKVEQLFVYGNHDIDGVRWNPKIDLTNPAVRAQYLGLGDNRKKAWEEAFHEEYRPIWLKTVKGYSFIGGHWSGYPEREAGDRDIEPFMNDNAAKLDPKLPFFYTQHAHPKDTCFNKWAWGHDDGLSTRVFSRFPNAVTFTGHSHYTLTDERTIWQGTFTSINTGSLSYSSVDYSLRSNVDGNSSGYRRPKDFLPKTEPEIVTWNEHQGMVMTVTDEQIRLERKSFGPTVESLGDDWVIPLPAAESRPFAYASHAAKRQAPEFPKDAVVKTEIVPADPKADKKCGVPGPYVKLTFPAAEDRGKCRVFEYEATAQLMEDDTDLVVCQRRSLANDFHRPVTKRIAEDRCRFALSELPASSYVRFSVRPIECFGKKGAPIFSSVMKTPDRAKPQEKKG